MATPVARGSLTAALPTWISPQLTQLVDTAPDGNQWLHEIKYDGYRIHARLDRGAVKLLTRTGLDLTRKYPAIAEAVAFSSVVDAVRCGAEVQRAMIDREAGTPEDRRIRLRIGINLGDVIVEDDD